jgi:Zinc knuckle
MRCFNCQQEGHIASQCDWVPGAGPGWATRSQPLHITRRPPDAPSDSYLAAKAELGMPTRPDLVALLNASCPWCLAGPHQVCVNRALGTPKRDYHETRYTAAGLDAPLRPALADTARRQADEARAERDKVQLR